MITFLIQYRANRGEKQRIHNKSNHSISCWCFDGGKRENYLAQVNLPPIVMYEVSHMYFIHLLITINFDFDAITLKSNLKVPLKSCHVSGSNPNPD